MKTTRQFLLLLLVAPAIFSFTGCGSQNEVIEVTDEAKSLYDEAGSRAESMSEAAMKEDR
ncbi:putative lipoprotein YajG [Rhodopirellula rubra]|uniref:Putative lipoprotein YajG n=1 Tax=Aporhodopirellula rubra TaxID=980271 RepID=A0A7W5E2I3_9BACT|nr:hypothetical protein [Aporhodopirellula rubra]MBB3208981.1 putative lipoprotein YajG [Aporhodopirellula rubra]